MEKEELLKILRSYHGLVDKEIAHGEADNALLAFIDDEEISEAFEKIDKWYA